MTTPPSAGGQGQCYPTTVVTPVATPMLPPMGYAAPPPPPSPAHSSSQRGRGRGRGASGQTANSFKPHRSQQQPPFQHHLYQITGRQCESQLQGFYHSGFDRSNYGQRIQHATPHHARAYIYNPPKRNSHNISSGVGGGPDGVPVMNFSLNTPKEIEAWIAERKKNWPTDSNFQKKEQNLNARIASGELVSKDRKRRNEAGGRGGAKRGRGKLGQRGVFNHQLAVYPESNLSSTAPTATTLYLTFTPPKPPPPKEQPVGLVAGYGSTSEEEEEEEDGPPEVVSSKESLDYYKEEDLPLTSSTSKSLPVCKYFARGKCGKGDKCRFKHDQSDKQTKRTETALKETEIFRGRPGLLRQEIRSETRTILQCLRFMVKNQFFDEGVKVWDVGISESNHVIPQEEMVDESSDECEEDDVEVKVEVQKSKSMNFCLPEELEGDILDWGSD